jgi:hypothetical protein
MIKNNCFNKSLNEATTTKYNFQNYVKPSYCHTCCLHILNTTRCYHEKTEFHKIAQHLRKVIPEQIIDIKQKVIEHKMIKKYMKKTFSNDSSSEQPDELENENKVIDEDTLRRIKRKSETYKRELDHRAERYERTKGIDQIVKSIQSSNKRLTTFQIDKYNKCLAKYPDNELLLSIQHLVPQNF